MLTLRAKRVGQTKLVLEALRLVDNATRIQFQMMARVLVFLAPPENTAVSKWSTAQSALRDSTVQMVMSSSVRPGLFVLKVPLLLGIAVKGTSVQIPQRRLPVLRGSIIAQKDSASLFLALMGPHALFQHPLSLCLDTKTFFPGIPFSLR